MVGSLGQVDRLEISRFVPFEDVFDFDEGFGGDFRFVADGRVIFPAVGVVSVADAPGDLFRSGLYDEVQGRPRLLQLGGEGVVAVDATYLQPFLPVVTDLQMYVAGEPYISGYTTQEGAHAASDRQEWTQVFSSEPSQQSAQRLWADGVRWLWLRETPEDAIMQLKPWASVVYANDQVTILQLSDPGANSE